jgi:hypothetical protein
MAWTEQELDAFRTMRDFYRSWIADIEAGNETTTRRVLGEVVDDRDDTLQRYKRNADELDGYLADA